MNIIFFGDSLTAGENCKQRYTDFLNYNVQNYAVSGTTIGEYSIYPVDGDSLLSQIAKHTEEIRDADMIYIEYGANDVSAIMCGFATVKTVVVSLVKAIDWIKQLNPHVTLTFLILGSSSVINVHSEKMCRYLENDYFSAFKFKFPETVYSNLYEEIIENVYKICNNVKRMYDDDMLKNFNDYLSSDGIHPNIEGHKRIAKNIMLP